MSAESFKRNLTNLLYFKMKIY